MKNFTFAVVGLFVLSTLSVAEAGRHAHRRHCCCQTYSYHVQQTTDSSQQATADSNTTQRFSYEPTVDATTTPVMTGSVVSYPSEDISRSRLVEQRRQHPGHGFRP